MAVPRAVARTRTPLAAAVRLLLSLHQRRFEQTQLFNALYQSSLRLQRASIVGGKASVYLTGSLKLGGECDNPRVVAQLRHTVRQFPSVRSAQIFVNGVPLRKAISLKG
jgi:hypothetical protein